MMIVDTLPPGFKTRAQRIKDAVNKENAQTTREWDAFLERYPNYEHGKDQIADREAIDLAERQGKRCARMDSRL